MNNGNKFERVTNFGSTYCMRHNSTILNNTILVMICESLKNIFPIPFNSQLISIQYFDIIGDLTFSVII